MVEKVSPSNGHLGDPVEASTAIENQTVNLGYVVPSASPTQLSVDDADITEANLNEFAETSSTTSFDVTIDPGEAFVGGSWLAIDVSTTVTLASGTTNQTVFVGWDWESGDNILIGLDSAFGAYEPQLPLWDFDTDANGVTNATDRRYNKTQNEVQTYSTFSNVPSTLPAGVIVHVDDEDKLYWEDGT